MTYDALVVGGGHNGLTCAFYLAKAGYRVRVLERRGIVGGAAITEEFHPVSGTLSPAIRSACSIPRSSPTWSWPGMVLGS